MISKNDVILDNEDIEIQLFLEGIYQKYGYDFREYSRAHIKRRLLSKKVRENFSSISEMQHRVIYDNKFFLEILSEFSINVTEMFRNPEFFLYFRKEVVPYLKSYPRIKIWHAGCSTGEEVYSMAILLKEEGLLERCQIYATDFNEKVLKKAKEGIFSMESIKDYTRNYIESGGKKDFSDYYIAKYDSAILNQSLKKHIMFNEHNLVVDQVFGVMNVIICKNVLIYFNKELQNKVLNLFDKSLLKGGILCLGSKESLKFSKTMDTFEVYDEMNRVYRKKFQGFNK
ncbi:CheR family methyltransferase [Oceanirhabdus sp. W0125-5]|uniref:CheR family methyltransferase n=1 Tax=Oceanirhabdus sp. W0125-5 TaxID=2999116 RepID=UPI0022F2E0B1|nr:protein-glutamate O-methyltransferase CheR [Oceanirhabdus sp. W0125-5]WBW96764.1 protein-glutamate O-methyltransferase CheR [Oceanirhabdus sp. W0125-5]